MVGSLEEMVSAGYHDVMGDLSLFSFSNRCMSLLAPKSWFSPRFEPLRIQLALGLHVGSKQSALPPSPEKTASISSY